jgi:hypothetical protein
MEANKNSIMSFEDRLQRGMEATDHTKKYFEEKGYKCENVISPVLWIVAKWHGNILATVDLILGDLILDDRILIDVKKNYISLKSIQKFQGDYFFIWNSSLQECLIFEPIYLRLLEINFPVTLPSGDPGLSFEQLTKLEYKRIEDFKL